MLGVFSCLLPSVSVTYGLQGIFALVFVPLRSEKLYDFCGALGWMSTTYVSLYYPALRAKYWDHIPGITLPSVSSFAPRQLLLTAALSLWALRLGTSLNKRVVKHGGDSRFDKHPVSFAAYWFAQATWITLLGLPVYLTNAVPPFAHPPLGPRDYASLALIAGSFLFEVIADGQISRRRRRKNNKAQDESFVSFGLWGISRHPNYVGKVGIWTGIYALSTVSLQTPVYPPWTIGLAAASPLSIYFLLRYLSNGSILEGTVDKKFIGNSSWEE